MCLIISRLGSSVMTTLLNSHFLFLFVVKSADSPRDATAVASFGHQRAPNTRGEPRSEAESTELLISVIYNDGPHNTHSDPNSYLLEFKAPRHDEIKPFQAEHMVCITLV